MKRYARELPVCIYYGLISGLLLAASLQSFAQPGNDINDINRINQLVSTKKTDQATLDRLKAMAESRLTNKDGSAQDLAVVRHAAVQAEALGNVANSRVAKGLSRLLLAKIAHESGDNETVRQRSREATDLLDDSNQPVWKAEAYLEAGGSYPSDPEHMAEKIRLYKQAAVMYHIAGDKTKEAGTKEFIGDLLQLNSQFPEALASLHEALALYQEAKHERLHGVYSLLGRAYQGSNQFIESLRYNLLAVETGEKLNDRSPLMVAVYNRTGLNYSAVKYFDQSLAYFKKGIALARENRDTNSIKIILINIGSNLCASGRYQESLDTMEMVRKYGEISSDVIEVEYETIIINNHIKLRQPLNAKPAFDRIQQHYRAHSMSETANQLIRLAAVLYLQANKRFPETKEYLKDYFKYADNIKLPLPKQSNAEIAAFRTDSAFNDLASAIKHFQKHKILADSSTNDLLKRQMGVLQIQFETQQKDKNIDLLTQKSKLQDASLQKEKIYRNIFIGGVIVLILFLALLYNRYRTKKSLSLKLERQQSEINFQNEKLKKLLDDKEWLLKEIHHRVKNNLQVVISLLNTQSKHLSSEEAIEAIRKSQQRMFAMSLIHQRLYQTDDLGSIEMSWYIRELVQYLQQSFNTERIKFLVDCDEMTLDVAQAVPLGLILNEAVTNSIKYAFPDNRNGRINIRLKELPGDELSLEIKDNGVGFPDGKLPGGSGALGVSLMNGLATQLHSDLVISSNKEGVSIMVQFLIRKAQTEEALEFYQV